MSGKNNKAGINEIQSLYINRLRSNKKIARFNCRDGLKYTGKVLAFDMYTVLVAAYLHDPSECRASDQVLIYKNNIISITPLDGFVPVIIERLDREGGERDGRNANKA